MELDSRTLGAFALIAIIGITIGYLSSQAASSAEVAQMKSELKQTQSIAAGLANNISIVTSNSENCESELITCQQDAAIMKKELP